MCTWPYSYTLLQACSLTWSTADMCKNLLFNPRSDCGLPCLGKQAFQALNLSCLSLRGHGAKLEVAKVAMKGKPFLLQPGLLLSASQEGAQPHSVPQRSGLHPLSITGWKTLHSAGINDFAMCWVEDMTAVWWEYLKYRMQELKSVQ